MTGHIEIFEDLGTLLDAAASAVVHTAEASIAVRGRFTIALSGGSTPVGLHERLAGAWRSRIDWSLVHVFWGDERGVAPGHPDSNYGMARRTLLDHVPIPAGQIYRMAGETEPAAAADDYATTLLAVLGDDGRGQLRNQYACGPTVPQSIQIVREMHRHTHSLRTLLTTNAGRAHHKRPGLRSPP